MSKMTFPIVPIKRRNTARRQFALASVGALAVLAVLAGGILLLSGVLPALGGTETRWLSAAPLLLVGLAFVALQILLPPRPRELIRHLIVALAFLLWGIDELLPPNVLAKTVGHLVILLYVVDLALTVRDRLATGWTRTTRLVMRRLSAGPVETTSFAPPGRRRMGEGCRHGRR